MPAQIVKKSLILKYEIYKEDGEEAVFTTQKFSVVTNATDEKMKQVGVEFCKIINSNSIFIRKNQVTAF